MVPIRLLFFFLFFFEWSHTRSRDLQEPNVRVLFCFVLLERRLWYSTITLLEGMFLNVDLDAFNKLVEHKLRCCGIVCNGTQKMLSKLGRYRSYPGDGSRLCRLSSPWRGE